MNLSDFERPLNERGQRDAPVVFAHLKEQGYKVDRIISSPATRALTTAKYLAAALEIPEEEIIREQEIYNAHFHDLLSVIRDFDDTYESIAMVGHNPGFTMVNNFLSETPIEYMPTCAVAGIDLNITNWKEVREGDGKTFCYLFPKLFKQDI